MVALVAIFSEFVSFETDRGFDISDDDVDTLDGHLVELEIIGREPIVRNYNVSIFLCWLDVSLKGWLRFVFVRFQQRC